MDTQQYERIPDQSHRNSQSVESFWDQRAGEFNKSHRGKGTGNIDKVVKALLDKKLLLDCNVLDVGGGTGRYVIPFSKYAREVTITDISTQMLACAKRNAENADCDNLEYVKLDWDEVDIDALDWGKRFDLVFASMCPSMRSKEGIKKMSAASCGWCQINQLIEMKDNFSQNLMQHFSIKPPHPDPHNDRDITQAFFNILWQQGYEPEITYLKEKEKQELTVEEAIERYSLQFDKAVTARKTELMNLLSDYASDGNIVIERSTTLSMILWKV